MFIPTSIAGDDLASRVANYLQISPTGRILQNLEWLGVRGKLYPDNKWFLEAHCPVLVDDRCSIYETASLAVSVKRMETGLPVFPVSPWFEWFE